MVTLLPGGGAEWRQLGVHAEFPTSNGRRVGRQRDLTIHLTSGDGTAEWSAVAATNRAKDRTDRFDFGIDHEVGEFLHLPRSSNSAEQDAWLIGWTYNRRAARTELHFLDLRRPEQTCTWQADVGLPPPFHGRVAAG